MPLIDRQKNIVFIFLSLIIKNNNKKKQIDVKKLCDLVLFYIIESNWFMNTVTGYT
jgi:hypothetical protein